MGMSTAQHTVKNSVLFINNVLISTSPTIILRLSPQHELGHSGIQSR